MFTRRSALLLFCVTAAAASCPSAPAWVSSGAGGLDDVHAVSASCSGVGACVRGACACQPGFSGVSCAYLSCPMTSAGAACSGNGQCLSLREETNGAYALWDADSTLGCSCDAGWSGMDCSQPQCPMGDDPLTPGLPLLVSLTCSCSSGTCTGAFALRYGGRSALVLPTAVLSLAEELTSAARGSGAAPGESVESVLGSLTGGVGRVFSSVTFATLPVPGAPTRLVCGGSQVIVTFNKAAAGADSTSIGGDAPLVADRSSLRDATDASAPFLVTSILSAATTEHAPCSARGVCNSGTGTCTCFPGFFSSDGNGGSGGTSDCGSTTPPGPGSVPGVAINCPGTPVCGGALRGWCDVTAGAFVCRCARGFSGGACEVVSCPTGPAWWSQSPLTSFGSAHPLGVACSGRGLCDDSFGVCKCAPGFTGSACDRLACPLGAAGGGGLQPCSGNGRCISLRALVARKGSTSGALPTVQTLTCSLSSGGITLTLLHAQSAFIPFDASATQLQAALDSLATAGNTATITTPPTGEVMCSPLGGGSVTTISFGFTTIKPAMQTTISGVIGAEQGVASITVVSPGTLPMYGATAASPETWDADMVHGCACDGGFTGTACEVPPPLHEL